MRKWVQISLAAVVVLLLGAAGVLFAKYRETNVQLAEAQTAEQEVQGRFAETLDAIAEIQDSLNAITVEEGAVMTPHELQVERRMGGDHSQEALERIALLRGSIQRSKERIDELESSLKESKVEVSGLHRMVDNLKRTVDEKETQIAGLTHRVESLQTEVGELATVVQVQDSTIEHKQRELATIYYIAGSKDELKDVGVIEPKGGILGIGKTWRPAATADPGRFAPLDTDAQSVIRSPTEKAQVLTAQPPSSYEIRMVNGNAELHILDPIAFRRVKQLIILTS